MEITKSKSQLIHEAAERLGLIGTGQPLDDEYYSKIEGNVDPLVLQLGSDGICNVSNDEAIPSEWFDALAGLLANVCAAVAGKNFDVQIKEYYESRLRRLTASGPYYTVLEVEYF